MRTWWGLLLPWLACTAPTPASSPVFEGDERLGAFRLVDLQPRQYSLKGGRGILRTAGLSPDAGLTVSVGSDGLESTFRNFAGFIPAGPPPGGMVEVFIPWAETPGTFDLSLQMGLEPDAGVVGRLKGAVAYFEAPALLKLDDATGTPNSRDLGVPVNVDLTSACVRSRAYALSNVGDFPATDVTVSAEGTGFSVSSQCPSSLTRASPPCAITVCFGDAPIGQHVGALLATAREHSTRAELRGVVQPRRADVEWMRPGPGVFFKGSGDRLAVATGTTRLRLFDARGVVVDEVNVGSDPTAFILAMDGDGAGGFLVLSRQVTSGIEQLRHLDRSGTPVGEVNLGAERVWVVSPTRVLVANQNQLTALVLPGLRVDTSWGVAGKVGLAEGLPITSVAGLPDGRVFAANNRGVVEFSSQGQRLAQHQASSLLAATARGEVLAATPVDVRRYASGTWSVLWPNSARVDQLTVDAVGRIMVVAGAQGERRRSDGSLEKLVTFVSAWCPAAGTCFIAGVEGPDVFLARLAD